MWSQSVVSHLTHPSLRPDRFISQGFLLCEMKDFRLVLFFLFCGFSSGVYSALIVEHDGRTTTDTQFCIGEQLTFRCTISIGSYDWIVPPFLNGTTGFGRIPVGESRTDGQFTLSSSGSGNARMSSLQVTVFEGLVGMFTCAETGNVGNMQEAIITVLDPPSAPSISATGNTMFSSFNLTIGHPTTSGICVQEYNLVVRQEVVVISNNNFMRSSLQDDRFIDLMAIDDSVTVRTCQYTYTFELTPVGGSVSSGIQTGDPNFNAVTSSSDQYGIENGVVSWEPAKAFSNTPIDCISGYQYTINGIIIGNVSNPSFTLDCRFTDIQSCAANILIIRPIVMAGNSVLNNVVVTGHTCNRAGLLLQTESTASLATTQTYISLQNLCNENIGALAGVTSVAAIYFIISVIIIITLTVAIKRLKLQLVQQKGQSQLEIDGTKSHKSSVNKASDIGMVKCQAYGEVGVKNRAGEINELGNNAGVYEHI